MFKEIKRMFKDTVVYGLGSILPKAAGIVLVPIYTRFLTPSDYGIISLATMITTLVGNVMLFGQQGSLVLYLRHLELKGQKEEARSMLFSVVTFTLAAAGLLFALLLIFGPRIAPYIVRQQSFTFKYLQIALITAYFGVTLDLLQATLRSRGNSVMYTLLQVSLFAANTGVTIWFVVHLRQGAYGSLKGNLGAEILLLPIALFLLLRGMRLKFSREWLNKSLLFGLPLIPHFFAGWMLTFSDRWILGHYRSLAEVGLYSLAYNLSMILNMFVSSINTAWGPVYYDLAATEEGRSKLPRLTTVFAASITMVAMGYLLFSREALLVLATARYHAAAPLVPIIVAGYFAFAMYVVLSTAIFYHRKTKYIPLISAGAAVVNISLNLLLVPRYGMWAAAWMTLVAYTIMAIAARMLSGRLFPGGFEDARIAKLVALFLAVFGANYGVNVLGLPVWGSIAAKLAVFTLASLSIVWLDIIAISELRALVDRVARRRQRARSMEEGRALEAAEQTIDGSMADDTGFHQDRS